MAKESEPVTFVVSGQPTLTRSQSAAGVGQVKASVRLSARRAAGETVRMEATPGEDIVLLHIANGPTLFLHPEEARELLQAQQTTSLERGAADAPADGEVIVPPQLSWRGLGDLEAGATTRGKVTDWIGNAVLDAIEIITGRAKDKAARIAAAAVTKHVDEQVDPGVYQLAKSELLPLKGSGKKLAKVPAPPSADDPMLVLIHGTFSNTAGTFGNLWTQHPGRVAAIFDRYGGRVYALDHETLRVSPFGNALTLVRALPKGARLHLLTHSRGGIVAEVLARICGGRGVQDEDFALFAGKDYQQHRAELEALAREIRARRIKIDRVIRVACPARGTLLASRRLDAYLSVLKWSMELAGAVILPQLVDFLAEVARRRTDPAELPGLEAMMPERAMTKWLSAPAEPVDGQLRVIAGDLEGDSLLTWVKTLLSDAFYWTDNDLVVQTRSMYGGTLRGDGAASFVLDRGGKVSHFNYFANERTAGFLTSALLEERPEHFRPIGPLSWTGEDPSGTRAARAAARSRIGNVAERPAVFVLPGILGSHLKVDGKRIWLSLRFISGLERLRWDPAKADRVVADGPIGMSYDDLIDHLADTHEVIPFSFDWRRPIEDEAKRLAGEVDKALTVRDATQQPVRFVAHSMGGLVMRTMCLERPATWKRYLERPGARFLMLGTPNGGSYAPMQVLSGDDAFGNLFTSWGGLFDGAGQRSLVAGMPGLLQLQADLIEGAFDLGRQATWEALQEADLKEMRRRIAQRAFWHRDPIQQREMSWGIPPQHVLDRAVRLRKRLDEQREQMSADAASTLLVVGKAKATPAAIQVVNEENVVYLDTSDGDGRVTLENAMLPGVPTWQVDVVHGELADAKKAFDAYVELLETGETTKLPRVAPEALRARRARGPEALIPSRPSRTMRAARPPAEMRDVFVSEPERASRRAGGGSRLNVRVVNGNLKFVREPLLVGHYSSLKLTGSEWVIDALVGNTMSESLRSGLYPAEVGSNQVFANSHPNPQNPFAAPRPAAAIVVGLGEEGSLRMSELIETIRQGTLAYAQRLVEGEGLVPTTFEIAATLIGSGGTAISPATSAQAVALGVAEANVLLSRVQWPLVSRLQLIELYLDRATEALNALKAFADTATQAIEVEPFIAMGEGGLPRPVEVGYRGVNSDFISIYEQPTADGSELVFTLSTRRARDEVRGTIAQSKLVAHLVEKGATDENEDPNIGRALFKLLVPLEIEPFLAGSTSLLLQLDAATAAYPWELLDIDRSDAEQARVAQPWGIQTRLLRKLRTKTFRESPRTAESSTGVLVIGEPQCPPDRYPRLPGAVAEAREVASVFGVTPILHESALAITKSVLNGSFAILHVSGHGDIVDGIGGVVLSDGMMFGSREVKSMRVVPQLAFINCCYLGSFIDPANGAKRLEARPQFAANVAEQLIRIGVRCVVAAGWAVEDDPAKLFARTFYQQLVNGQRFIDAVANARALTYARYPRSNTWAAYQCYGDPDWTYQGAAARAAKRFYTPEIPSPSTLELQLQTLVMQHRFDGLADDEMRERLDGLANVCKGRWDRQGALAAAFGAAYGEIDDLERAIEWYSRALEAPDAGAGLSALEQLGHLRVRRGAERDDREEILAAIELLERVFELGATAERKALLGAAYKALAGAERSATAQREALNQARAHYDSAVSLAREHQSADSYSPAIERMRIDVRQQGGSAGGVNLEPAELERIRESALRKNEIDPDVSSVLIPIELAIYEALSRGSVAAAADTVLADLADIEKRARSSRAWHAAAYEIRWALEPYREKSSLSVREQDAIQKLLKSLPKTKRVAKEAAEEETRAKARKTPRKKSRKPKKK